MELQPQGAASMTNPFDSGQIRPRTTAAIMPIESAIRIPLQRFLQLNTPLSPPIDRYQHVVFTWKSNEFNGKREEIDTHPSPHCAAVRMDLRRLTSTAC